MPPELDLTALDPANRPVGPRSQEAAAAEIPGLGERLDALQEALYAEAAGGGRRALLPTRVLRINAAAEQGGDPQVE
jgi:hypothetical protein